MHYSPERIGNARRPFRHYNLLKGVSGQAVQNMNWFLAWMKEGTSFCELF
jgi:hypothetical protein